MKAPTRAKPKPKAKATRPGSVFIELGDLYHTLRKIAAVNALAAHDNANMSRTVRRLIHQEATRLGIFPKPKETNP